MAESKTNRRITISEIIEWDGSWELIDGIPYNMTPAPTTHHQQIVGELFSHYGHILAMMVVLYL